MQICNLFKKVLVADNGLAETNVLSDACDDQNDEARHNRIRKKHNDHAENPREHVEPALVRIELADQSREIEELKNRIEYAYNALPQPVKDLRHIGK